MFVYIKSDIDLWTVGFYGPDGKWNPESDHETKEAAAERVHYLNGEKTIGETKHTMTEELLEALKELMEGIEGREKRTGIIQLVPCVDKARAAIAKAEGKTK